MCLWNNKLNNHPIWMATLKNWKDLSFCGFQYSFILQWSKVWFMSLPVLILKPSCNLRNFLCNLLLYDTLARAFNISYISAMVKLLHNYAANYAAPSANGMWALVFSSAMETSTRWLNFVWENWKFHHFLIYSKCLKTGFVQKPDIWATSFWTF